jgi:hypothetical protein
LRSARRADFEAFPTRSPADIRPGSPISGPEALLHRAGIGPEHPIKTVRTLPGSPGDGPPFLRRCRAMVGSPNGLLAGPRRPGRLVHLIKATPSTDCNAMDPERLTLSRGRTGNPRFWAASRPNPAPGGLGKARPGPRSICTEFQPGRPRKKNNRPQIQLGQL